MYSTEGMVKSVPGTSMVHLTQDNFMEWFLTFSREEIQAAEDLLELYVGQWYSVSNPGKRL